MIIKQIAFQCPTCGPVKIPTKNIRLTRHDGKITTSYSCAGCNTTNHPPATPEDILQFLYLIEDARVEAVPFNLYCEPCDLLITLFAGDVEVYAFEGAPELMAVFTCSNCHTRRHAKISSQIARNLQAAGVIIEEIGPGEINKAIERLLPKAP